MIGEIRARGGDIDAIYYCPHGWDEGCECRKPKPGMLFSAQRDFHLDLSRTYFIGDDVRDKQAADAAGSLSLLVSEELPLQKVVREQILNGNDRSGGN
jgi:D-glycero-D-manno-heptose 1,7-bisphosphate phosphatase